MTSQEMLDKRNRAIAKARTMLDAAETEDRSLDAEQVIRYDAYMAEAADYKTRFDRQDALEREERALAAPPVDGRQAGRENAGSAGDGTTEERAIKKYGEVIGARIAPLMDKEYWASFVGRFLRTGSPRGMFLGDDKNSMEVRNLQADDAVKGGFAVAPEQFVTDLIQGIDDEVLIRQWANVVPVVGSDSLGRPSLDTDPADADWTTELATGDEDTAMTLGKRELTPHPVAKRIKVSRKLLRSAALPIDTLVRQRLAYKFGVTQEKAFLTGTGAGQPLGVFTASADGISTARDVDTGSTTTFTTDGIKDAKYALKAAYWPTARWLIHRQGQKLIAKIKSVADGVYMWEPSQKVGEPDMLYGMPIHMSEYVPAVFTAGLYVAILGDWARGYMIADSLLLDLQVLTELYAESNEIGYIGRAELDGMPVLEEAFVRLKTDDS